MGLVGTKSSSIVEAELLSLDVFALLEPCDRSSLVNLEGRYPYHFSQVAGAKGFRLDERQG